MPRHRPRGFSPRRSASARSVSKQVEAPSESLLELPAVTTPPSRTGLSACKLSNVVSGRLPSSLSSVTSLYGTACGPCRSPPSSSSVARSRRRIGRPPAQPRCDVEDRPHSGPATRARRCASSTRTRPSAASACRHAARGASTLSSFSRATQAMYGACTAEMFSWPPATTASIPSTTICLAAVATTIRPEAHWRSMVCAATLTAARRPAPRCERCSCRRCRHRAPSR